MDLARCEASAPPRFVRLGTVAARRRWVPSLEPLPPLHPRPSGPAVLLSLWALLALGPGTLFLSVWGLLVLAAGTLLPPFWGLLVLVAARGARPVASLPGLAVLSAILVAGAAAPTLAPLAARSHLRLLAPAALPQAGGVAVPAPAGVAPVATVPAVPTPVPCRLLPGFAPLQEVIADAVGECLDDARSDPATGNTVQRTAGGLLVARPSGGVAFTDGVGTWLDGPHGLAYRPNAVRFPWETNTAGLPVVAEGDPSLAAPGALLPAHRIVAYYGVPLVPGMGVLGQRSPEQMLDALERQAQQYAAADPATPAQTALEPVVSVATSTPGPDGLYRRRAVPEEIEQVAQWAERRGDLLILDVQPGRSSVGAEVEALLPYLERPYVHLAIDPEWAMAAGQVPGTTFGTVAAATVNETIQTLARVVSRHRLPPKLLLVHRFRDDMLTGSDQIHPDPRVQVVIVMDGVGSQGAKADVYRHVVHDQPVQFAGLKIFITQDIAPFSPRQALGLAPAPHVVIYQ